MTLAQIFKELVNTMVDLTSEGKIEEAKLVDQVVVEFGLLYERKEVRPNPNSPISFVQLEFVDGSRS
jgi:hypothetical protein